jgi:hypothetical protein
LLSFPLLDLTSPVLGSPIVADVKRKINSAAPRVLLILLASWGDVWGFINAFTPTGFHWLIHLHSLTIYEAEANQTANKKTY